MNEELASKVAQEIGMTMLAMVRNANQLRHKSLKGHLYYCHEQDDYGKPSADIIRWLRWMTAYGEENRNNIGYPHELLIAARLIFDGDTYEALDG